MANALRNCTLLHCAQNAHIMSMRLSSNTHHFHRTMVLEQLQLQAPKIFDLLLPPGAAIRAVTMWDQNSGCKDHKLLRVATQNSRQLKSLTTSFELVEGRSQLTSRLLFGLLFLDASSLSPRKSECRQSLAHVAAVSFFQ